jgi:ankyrin repeat protein
VRYGRAECVRLLLSAGAQVNTPNNEKQTPLAYALMSRNKPIIKMLQEAGANKETTAPVLRGKQSILENRGDYKD